MIALICPTRGRPSQFKRMHDSAHATAQGLINIYAASNGKDDYVPTTIEDIPTVHTWNALAQNAMKSKSNKLFMLCADDVIFEHHGWNKRLMDHYEGLANKVHVYALQDSRDKDGTPHPIVTREYIEAMGYFMPPIYLHWFVDTWTVEIAKANNCFTHMRDIKLIHDKPNDRGLADETHQHIRRKGWLTRDTYVHESCKHFLAYEKRRLGEYL